MTSLPYLSQCSLYVGLLSLSLLSALCTLSLSHAFSLHVSLSPFLTRADNPRSHQVSYQQAINHDFPCMGIVVATPGFALRRAGIPRGAVILAVDEQEVLTLDDLQNAMQRIPHGGHAAFRYVFLSDQSGERVDVVTIDRMWNSAQRFQR